MVVICPAGKRRRWDQHREVGLAAGTRKCGCDIGLLARRRLHAEDQHVLGQPASLASHSRRDAQREALLPEQRVAAVAAAERPDRVLFGEVNDVLVLFVAGPRHVAIARRKGHPHGVQAGHEAAVRAQRFGGGSSHARHHAHAHGHIGRVGDLDPDVRDGRTDGSHGEGQYVHGAPTHAAIEQALQPRLHLGGVHPIVGGTGVSGLEAADECPILDARYVRGIRSREEAAGPLIGVQADQGSGLHQFVAQAVVLCLRAVAPDYALGRVRRAVSVTHCAGGGCARSQGSARWTGAGQGRSTCPRLLSPPSSFSPHLPGPISPDVSMGDHGVNQVC